MFDEKQFKQINDDISDKLGKLQYAKNTIEEMVEENDILRKALNSDLLPSFYGLEKAINPEYKSVSSLYNLIEKRKKVVIDSLIVAGIDLKPHEKYNLYLLNYIQNPSDTYGRPPFARLFVFGLSQLELRGYKRQNEKFFYQYNKIIDEKIKYYEGLKTETKNTIENLIKNDDYIKKNISYIDYLVKNNVNLRDSTNLNIQLHNTLFNKEVF